MPAARWNYRCRCEEWPDWFQACHLPVENSFHFLTAVTLAPPEPGACQLAGQFDEMWADCGPTSPSIRQRNLPRPTGPDGHEAPRVLLEGQA